ncbi:hypothetical protein D3C81_814710 [compost metagenome]
MGQHKFIHLNVAEVLDMFFLHDFYGCMYLRRQSFNAGSNQERLAVNQRIFLNPRIRKNDGGLRLVDAGFHQDFVRSRIPADEMDLVHRLQRMSIHLVDDHDAALGRITQDFLHRRVRFFAPIDQNDLVFASKVQSPRSSLPLKGSDGIDDLPDHQAQQPNSENVQKHRKYFTLDGLRKIIAITHRGHGGHHPI